ncbi:MAG: tetratricopeptide repeat protein, partial [Bacteroidales bacterium]
GIMAERFLYAPVLGFAIVANYYLFKLLPRERKTKRIIYDFRPGASKLFLGLLTVLLLFYSIRTIARNPVWKDNYTLFSTDIRNGGNSALLRKHYGSELINRAVVTEDKALSDSLMQLGIAEVQKSLEINPRFSEAHFKLGYAYYQLRDFDRALEYYKHANQNNSTTVSNMALAYYMTGEYGEALRMLKRALQLDPENATARKNLPLVQGAFNRKLKSLQEDGQADPESLYEMGNLFVDQKNYAEALKAYQAAIQLDPEYIGAMINMGNCFYMLQDYNSAINTFDDVLEKDPDNRMAMRNLSHLHGLVGNNEMQMYFEQKAMEPAQ